MNFSQKPIMLHTSPLCHTEKNITIYLICFLSLRLVTLPLTHHISNCRYKLPDDKLSYQCNPCPNSSPILQELCIFPKPCQINVSKQNYSILSICSLECFP